MMGTLVICLWSLVGDRYWFEIGSQFFDSSLLWFIMVFFLRRTGCRDVVEAKRMLKLEFLGVT